MVHILQGFSILFYLFSGLPYCQIFCVGQVSPPTPDVKALFYKLSWAPITGVSLIAKSSGVERTTIHVAFKKSLIS